MLPGIVNDVYILMIVATLAACPFVLFRKARGLDYRMDLPTKFVYVAIVLVFLFLGRVGPWRIFPVQLFSAAIFMTFLAWPNFAVLLVRLIRPRHQLSPEILEKLRLAIPAEASLGAFEHYLYFPQQKNADDAAERLRRKSWEVKVEISADGKEWLLLATEPSTAEDIERQRDELEALAESFGGEYDGWGAAVGKI